MATNNFPYGYSTGANGSVYWPVTGAFCRCAFTWAFIDGVMQAVPNSVMPGCPQHDQQAQGARLVEEIELFLRDS